MFIACRNHVKTMLARTRREEARYPCWNEWLSIGLPGSRFGTLLANLNQNFFVNAEKVVENAWSLPMRSLIVPNEELKNNSDNNSDGDRLLPPTIHAFESPLPGEK